MKVSLLVGGVLFLASASAFQVQNPHHVRSVSSFRRVATELQATFVDIDENAKREVGAMDEWASACGVQRAGGVQLTSEDGVDFSVMTSEDIPAESPVLFVPGNMIFSSSQARQEFYGPSLQAAEELLVSLEVGDHLAEFSLYLKVLTELERGDESPWFPWFNSLPRTFYNGASMTPFCYECLPPLVGSLAKEERAKNIYFHEALKKVDFISEKTKDDRDLARWAFQIVCTRSFEADGDRRIAPMADMFNHGTETEVVLSYDEEGNCYGYTTQDVPAGSPLRVSYGSPTNPSRLFARYGFLDETSPATFCKIMLRPSGKLVDMGYDHTKMLFYKDTGEVSAEVFDVLLYQLLESDRTTREAFYQAHMQGDQNTKNAIHQQYYDQTVAALNSHVNSFLVQLDELSSKGVRVGRDIKNHPRLPLILKHNDFVKQTFLKVRARFSEVTV